MELNKAAPNRVQIVSRVATAANNAPKSKKEKFSTKRASRDSTTNYCFHRFLVILKERKKVSRWILLKIKAPFQRNSSLKSLLMNS